MIGSDHAASDWLTLESNLIHVMMDMESKWTSAIEAAHKCRGLKSEPPGQCVIYLDKALNEAHDMEILIRKYIKILTEMKDQVQ